MGKGKQRWFRVRLAVPAETAEDAGAALLGLGGTGVRVDEGPLSTRLETYYPRDLTSASAGVARAFGGRILSARWVEEEDWSVSWRERVRGRVIGRFFVRPAHVAPRRGKLDLAIDPGMAFGTGEHPTTRLMLLEMQAMAAESPLGRFLDLGCGSGILAMAAAVLAAHPVLAVDSDARAVEVARANARSNGFGRRIRFAVGGLDSCAGPFDTLVANLTTDAHLALASSYGRRLAPGGRLLLGGVRSAEARLVAERAGARVARRGGGWVVLRSERATVRSRGNRREG
ncbi:MAG: 50S ribosomal protein L11 methyltransferase [Planctomycetes bacterium]|nr:50S ribosomal protein L11 methyltransferase [Planctomycetota bacterium]